MANHLTGNLTLKIVLPWYYHKLDILRFLSLNLNIFFQICQTELDEFCSQFGHDNFAMKNSEEKLFQTRLDSQISSQDRGLQTRSNLHVWRNCLDHNGSGKGLKVLNLQEKPWSQLETVLTTVQPQICDRCLINTVYFWKLLKLPKNAV